MPFMRKWLTNHVALAVVLLIVTWIIMMHTSRSLQSVVVASVMQRDDDTKTKEWIIGTGVHIVTPINDLMTTNENTNSSLCFPEITHGHITDNSTTIASVFEIFKIVTTLDTAENASMSVVNESIAIIVPTGHQFQLESSILEYASRNLTNARNNYGGLFTNGHVVVNLTAIEEIVAQMNHNVSRYLDGYNCRDFFPYYTCINCTESYAAWSCSTMFSLARVVTIETGPSETVHSSMQPVLPCDKLCHRVMQTCPVELQFDCPDNYDQSRAECVLWSASIGTQSSVQS